MGQNSAKIASDSGFEAIHVSTLRGDMKIFFDVYIRVAGKNILYCRQGDSFEGLRLERLRSKKLDKMYIRIEDLDAYERYLNANIDQAYDKKSGKTLDIRCEVIQGFQQAVTEKFMDHVENQSYYNQLRISGERFTTFLGEEASAMQHLLAIKNLDQNVAHHGFNVAALTTMMIRENSPTDIRNLPLVALGCFLHDIDLFERGVKRTTAIENLSPTEKTAYLEHPTKGAEILQGKGFVEPLVFKIISQHEENAQGNGFPRGIGNSQIEPLVLFVGAANSYDRLTSFEGLAPKDAMKKIMMEKLGLYPLEHLQLLQNLLKRAQVL